MNNMNRLIASTLVSVGIVAASLSLASAQSVAPPAAGATQAPERHHGMRHEHGKRGFSTAGERIEARLAYQKTALKITDAQQAQWNAFADMARKQAAERDKKMTEMRAQWQQGSRSTRARPTAIARMEREQQRHADAVVRLNEQLAVQKPLYAALSPEQKTVADKVLAPRGEMGERGGMRGHGGHRHGGRAA